MSVYDSVCILYIYLWSNLLYIRCVNLHPPPDDVLFLHTAYTVTRSTPSITDLEAFSYCLPVLSIWEIESSFRETLIPLRTRKLHWSLINRMFIQDNFSHMKRQLTYRLHQTKRRKSMPRKNLTRRNIPLFLRLGEDIGAEMSLRQFNLVSDYHPFFNCINGFPNQRCSMANPQFRELFHSLPT